MSTEFGPAYGAALRAELMRRVQKSNRPRWPRSRVALVASVLAVTAGAGTAAVAGANTFLLPGAPVIAKLGAAVVQEHQGSATVDLGTAPTGANSIAVDFACLSAGHFNLDDGSSVTCAISDIGSTTTSAIPLTSSRHTVTVTAANDMSWRISAAYVNSTTSPWAKNAKGQTYGTINSQGSPDLVAVQTTTGKNGYVFSNALADADGTTAAQSFKSPQDALDWQKSMAGKSIVVPVYLSDGSTRIGDFVVNYPPAP